MDAILVPSASGADEAGSVRAGHVTSAWVGELGAAVQDGFLDDAPMPRAQSYDPLIRTGLGGSVGKLQRRSR